jgi:DUF971 family protein
MPEPISVKVHKSSGEGVDIAWKDGHQSHFSFEFLRAACPCAVCKAERDKQHRLPGEVVPPNLTAPAVLPIYKPVARPESAEMAGNYAIIFTWNDGHREGIYSWSWLRSLCGCPECEQAKEDVAGLQLDIRNHKPRGCRDHKH